MKYTYSFGSIEIRDGMLIVDSTLPYKMFEKYYSTVLIYADKEVTKLLEKAFDEGKSEVNGLLTKEHFLDTLLHIQVYDETNKLTRELWKRNAKRQIIWVFKELIHNLIYLFKNFHKYIAEDTNQSAVLRCPYCLSEHISARVFMNWNTHNEMLIATFAGKPRKNYVAFRGCKECEFGGFEDYFKVSETQFERELVAKESGLFKSQFEGHFPIPKPKAKPNLKKIIENFPRKIQDEIQK